MQNESQEFESRLNRFVKILQRHFLRWIWRRNARTAQNAHIWGCESGKRMFVAETPVLENTGNFDEIKTIR
jgi:hypothetical protein